MKKSLFVLILIGGWVIPSWAQNNKEFEQLCKKYQDSENVGSFASFPINQEAKRQPKPSIPNDPTFSES